MYKGCFLIGDCDEDADCSGNLMCMQSETMPCPAYHGGIDSQLDCCILP